MAANPMTGRLRRCTRLTGGGRVLAAVGIVLAVAGCSHIAPLGPDPLATLPPPHHLRSPIIVQVMRSQPPTPTGKCPAGSVDLFGLEPNVLRTAVGPALPAQPVHGSTPTPTPAATPAMPVTPTAPPVGVACYRPVGSPVTVTSAAVSSVTTYRNHSGPTWYAFVVAFPTGDVAALTALIQQAL